MNRIINFHAVQDTDWFRKMLNILKNNYNLISIQDLESYYYDENQLSNTCHITIDDGHKSFYETMYPVLKEMEVPASLFVSPQICLEGKNFWFQEIQSYKAIEFKLVISKYLKVDFKHLSPYSINTILKILKIEDIWKIINLYKNQFQVGKLKAQNMNIQQLIEVDRDKLVAIGAHTNNHPILSNEDDETSKQEISASFVQLEEILGHQIKYFAFPNGLPNLDFGQREIDILKSINCKLAFTTQAKNISNNDDNAFCIPRFGISFGNVPFIKSKLLLGAYWEHLKIVIKNSESINRNKLKSKFQ
jgi:peptidoglycan/xylan/chitin deacetylase (PgdA/CDA1 family)